MLHSSKNDKTADIRQMVRPDQPGSAGEVSYRQAALLRMIQALDKDATHRIELQTRGREPWNVSVTHEDMDLRVAAGKELSREERWRREEDPLDIWDKMLLYANSDTLPDQADSYRMKYYGLFSTGEGEGSFMLRIKMPGNTVSATQLKGLADMARDLGSGAADITSRGNLQVREIRPRHSLPALMLLNDLGLTSRGAGADNVRNITATPISGIDRQELVDVRPYAKSLHHYILNNRDLYGLPRKFNIAFDNGGPMSVSAETNDIGVIPVRVTENPEVPPGVYFRVLLAGLPGQGRLANDAGILLAEQELLPVVIAMIKVFDEHGDRTDRRRARLRFLLDDWGLARFLDVVEELLPFRLRRLSLLGVQMPAKTDRLAHIGVHPQRQEGLRYIGVAVSAGRLSAAQMAGVADLAGRYGSGEIRLTVWQNLIIPNVPEAVVDTVAASLVALGLSVDPGGLAGGLLACTGADACSRSLTHTKRHALELAQAISRLGDLDTPLQIHVNGCRNACARHTCADIGLLGCRTKHGDAYVEAYHVALGGGLTDTLDADDHTRLGRRFFEFVPAVELSDLLCAVIAAYRAERGDGESFRSYIARQELTPFAARFRPDTPIAATA